MWHKKEGKFHFSSSTPPSSGVGRKIWPKRARELRGYPQGCPGDARFPGVIHLVEEVLGIIHVLHRVVFTGQMSTQIL